MRWINPVTGEAVYPRNLNKHDTRVFSETFKAAAGLKRSVGATSKRDQRQPRKAA